jgi:hypothetical protein
MQRWLSDGHVGMWVPQSRVEHIITPDRLEPDHIRRFFFGLAETKRPQGKADWPLVRFLRGGWYACRAMTYQALSGLYRQDTQPHRWMKCLKQVSYCWGRVESQWDGFPSWLKPAPVKRLKQGRCQPRFEMPVNVPGTDPIFESTKMGLSPLSRSLAAAPGDASTSSPAMPYAATFPRKAAVEGRRLSTGTNIRE